MRAPIDAASPMQMVLTRGRTRGGGPGTVTVAAGEDWDAVVAWTMAEGLAGLECLSGIPGLAGATPIQNVGAYGQEVGQAITGVRAYDRAAGKIVTIPNERCGFGYRTSRFRRSPGGRMAAGRVRCAAARSSAR